MKKVNELPLTSSCPFQRCFNSFPVLAKYKGKLDEIIGYDFEKEKCGKKEKMLLTNTMFSKVFSLIMVKIWNLKYDRSSEDHVETFDEVLV